MLRKFFLGAGLIILGIIAFNRLFPMIGSINKDVNVLPSEKDQGVKLNPTLYSLNEVSAKSIQFFIELQDKNLLVYPIDYEVYAPSEEESIYYINDWLDNDSGEWIKEGHMFFGFSEDIRGKYYLWQGPNIRSEPPVVLLSAGGGEAHIVSKNIDDFIQLLGAGYHFDSGYWRTFHDIGENYDFETLKSQIEKKFGVWNWDPDYEADEHGFYKLKIDYVDFMQLIDKHRVPPEIFNE